MTTTHAGSCHCGAVRYEVKAEIAQAMQCNCSHCSKKGFLLAFVPFETFTLLQGGEALTEYRFNTHKIAHQFCKTCGVEFLASGEGPGGAKMAAINVRCLDDFDIEALEIQSVNGRDF